MLRVTGQASRLTKRGRLPTDAAASVRDPKVEDVCLLLGPELRHQKRTMPLLARRTVFGHCDPTKSAPTHILHNKSARPDNISTKLTPSPVTKAPYIYICIYTYTCIYIYIYIYAVVSVRSYHSGTQVLESTALAILRLPLPGRRYCASML